MKTLDMGQTLSIIANLGVIAGIVFLAVEVRQNQATLERGNAMDLVAVASIRGLIARSRNYETCWTERVRPAAERTGYFGFIEGVDAGRE